MSTGFDPSSTWSLSPPHASLRPNWKLNGADSHWLDDIHSRLQSRRDVGGAMTDLFLEMHRRKTAMTEPQWLEQVAAARKHPVKSLLHQDPLTYRAFAKPRGYAGDAEMLDYIYSREENWPAPDATPLGRQLFDFTIDAPASEGVRARREFISHVVDRLVETNARPSVLSVAAGHLREAEMTASIKRRRFKRYVALDADELSLQEVSRRYGTYGVETMAANVRAILAGKIDPGKFDLIYSTGLFDYLGAPVGRRLTFMLFKMLRPGGRLLLANFLPGIRDVGYMEAFMDWKLIYRNRQDMIDLTMDIPQEKICDIRLVAEENQNIIFAEVRRL